VSRTNDHENEFAASSDTLSYIPNITSCGAIVLAGTCAQRSAVPIREFLHRYLGREHTFSASIVSAAQRHLGFAH
jgi:hypothetical protein